MGNVCFKGYSPKKGPKDATRVQDKTQNGKAVNADIEVSHKTEHNLREASQISLGSTGTLSDEEVSVFFTSPEDKYEIRQRRQSHDKGSSGAKSQDDLNANDIRLDLYGIHNPAFTSDNGEVLDTTLQSPPKSEVPISTESTPDHRPDLVRIPDSFKLSKNVINKDQVVNTDTGSGTPFEGTHNLDIQTDNETADDHDKIPRPMSSEEVVDLIDKLLLTNPGQSSTDPTDSVTFSVGSSFSTSQEDTGIDQEQRTEMDSLKSTATRGKLTRMPHINELAEELDITLRNQVLLETGHRLESHVKNNGSSSLSSNSPSAKDESVSNGRSHAISGPSISSNNSMGDDEDELWTGIEMKEQNLLSRIAECEVTKDDEILDVLDNISRHRQRMLAVRWAMPYKEDQNLSPELTQEKLVQKLEIERAHSKKLDDLNREIASNLINAKKSTNMESLQAIIDDHKRRQSALHAQLMAQKERLDRRLAEKLKVKQDCKADDFDADSEDSNIERILGMSLDEIRRNPNKEASIENESPLDYDGRFSRISDIRGDVEDHETDDLILTAYEELLDHSSDEEPLSTDNSPQVRGHGKDEDGVTSSALRSTLKEEVKCHLNKMTESDFQQLLDVYRQEEKGQNETESKMEKGKKESLWIKMENNRQNESKVEKRVGHPSVSKTDAATEVGSSMMMHQQNDVAVQATEMSNVNKDVQTIQKKFVQEVEVLDNDLINKLSKRQETMAQEELEKLLKSHFDSVEDLRKRRQRESDKIQKQLEEKLHSKMRKLPSESQEDCGSGDVIKRNTLVGSNAETEYKVHKKEMEKTDQAIEDNELQLRKKVNKKVNDLSVDDVQQLLKDYRKQQKDLLQKRDIRRKLMNDKLLAVLKERNLKKLASQESNNSELIEDDPNLPTKVISKRKTILDVDVEEMDADFYKGLMERYGKSSLTEAELEMLLEGHLDKVEAFQKKVKGALSKKRKERTAAEKEERRLRKMVRKQAEEGNAKRANELVQKQQEQANQMRQLRERERKRASLLLREKLARKQLMSGEPLSDLKIDS